MNVMSFTSGLKGASGTLQTRFIFAVLTALFLIPEAQAQVRGGFEDWDRLLDAGRKEGKVTVSIPASAELRKQLEENFKKKFGIEMEVFTARGSAAVRRMADEFKSGVRHFDLHI